MQIKKLEIENFKSFQNQVSLDLGKRNIILGKNGSGKSNLLAAISTVFLVSEPTDIKYNTNEDETNICVEIDNRDRRFPLGADTVRIKFVIGQGGQTTVYVNERQVSREELQGMYENAGLQHHNFVEQGYKLKDNNIYELVMKVSGAEKFKESKEYALKNLDESDILYMIEKLEYKNTKYSNFTKRLEEFLKLDGQRKEIEFQLFLREILEITNALTEHSRNVSAGEESIKSPELFEMELEELRQEIIRSQRQKEDLEKRISRIGTVEKIKKIRNSEYDEKISDLEKRKNEIEIEIEKSKLNEENFHIDLKATQLFISSQKKSEEGSSFIEEQLYKRRKELENKDVRKENLRKLIEKQKILWMKKSSLKEQEEELIKKVEGLERKLLYTGTSSINVVDSMNHNEGVYGTVFSLLDVPERYEEAFEAVARGSLFYVVVENEEVGLRCIREQNEHLTLVALNRLGTVNFNTNHIQSSHYIGKLSDLVRVTEEVENPRLRTLVNFICRRFIVCENLKKALVVNERFGVNVVTLEGDIVYGDGTISGGYESSFTVLKGYRVHISKLRECRREMKKIEDEIEVTEKEVEVSSFANDGDDVNLRAVIKYLEMKKVFIEKGDILIEKLSDIQLKIVRERNRKMHQLENLSAISKEIFEKKAKRSKIQVVMDMFSKVEHLKEEIDEKIRREIKMMEEFSTAENAGNSTVENSLYGKMAEQTMLRSKRDSLMKKIGLRDISAVRKSVQSSVNKEMLMVRLKGVMRDLKPYELFAANTSSTNSFKALEKLFNVEEVKGELERLRKEKTEILKYIDYLEKEKDDKIELTFSMIADAYSYYYEYISSRKSVLQKISESVNVVIEGECVNDLNGLSGGQKMLISTCLILAIQKVVPSPFCVFDELDANLDIESTKKVYELLCKSDSQLFISTFKKEGVVIGDKYIGVALENKHSVAGEINYDLAMKTLEFTE